MNDWHTVGKAGVDLELRIFYQFGRKRSCIQVRDYLVVIAMHDECGNVDLFQIAVKVGF